MHYVYMIQNSIDKLYTGISQNPQERVTSHNQKRGAQFTKHIPNFEIVFIEKHEHINEARKREIQIKKWSRKKKEILIERYRKGLATKIEG